MNQFVFFLCLLFPAVATAGMLDVSHDRYKSGTAVTTFVLAGAPVKSTTSILVADSTGYGETFVGTSFGRGGLTVTPYAGVEWFRGDGPKSRGLVITSFTTGKFTFDNANEFGGVTGNFHKTTVGYRLSEGLKASLVHHSVAGTGVRADVASWQNGPTLYMQVLERRTTGGITFAF